MVRSGVLSVCRVWYWVGVMCAGAGRERERGGVHATGVSFVTGVRPVPEAGTLKKRRCCGRVVRALRCACALEGGHVAQSGSSSFVTNETNDGINIHERGKL